MARPDLGASEPGRSLGALVVLAADPNPEIRRLAYNALEALAREHPALGPPRVLVEAPESDIPANRKAAAVALGRYRGGAEFAVPILFRAAEASDGQEEAEWIVILNSLPPSAAVVPLLTEKLGHSRPTIRACAAKMLAAIGPAAQPAIPDLIALLDEPPAEPTDIQRQLLGDDDTDPALAAVWALQSIAPRQRGQHTRAGKALRAFALRHDASSLRGSRARDALPDFGPDFVLP
jgi:hypothetical protein